MGIVAAIGAIVGVGVAGAGYVKQQSAAKEMAQAQQDQIAQQQKIEAQRKQQMELEAARAQKQVLRNQQRARAMSLATATAQGASYGSALPGAYGGESGQANTNLLSIGQNLQIGQNIFGYNQQISNDRIAYAGAQADYAAGQGLSSLGGALVSNAQTITNIGQVAFRGLQNGLSFGTGPGSYGMGNNYRTS